MTDSPQPAAAQAPAVYLRAHYIKDLSFENPRAPGSIFTPRNEAPQMDVSISLAAQRLDENVFELAIHIAARAVAEKTTLFLCDVVYAGIIELQNMAVEQFEEAVFIPGAQLLYPFARRVIADITRDGGFPPLQLDPMDFPALFRDQQAQKKTATA